MKKRSFLTAIVVLAIAFFSFGQHDEWENYTSSVVIKEIVPYNNELLMGGTGSGLIRFNLNSYQTTICNMANSGIISNVVSSIAVNGSDIWAGSMLYHDSWFSGGLSHFDGSSWEVFTTENSDLPSNKILSLAVAPNGDLWAGFSDVGVGVFDGTSWFTYNSTNSIISDDIRDIEIDYNGNIWAVQNSGGFAVYDGIEWQVFTKHNSGLPENDINDIELDGEGNAWIGSDGVSVLDTDGNWTYYNEDNSGISSSVVNNMYWDGSGMWFAMNTGGGVCHFENGNWTVYQKENSGLSSNWNSSIYKDHNGILWVGTTGNGVDSFDGNNWQNHLFQFGEMPDDNTHDISIGSDSRVWIGTSKGLIVKNGMYWEYYNSENSPIVDFYVNSVVTDNAGGCWIANTSDGLYYFTGSQFIDYTYASPLFGDEYIELVEMHGDELWVGMYGEGVVIFDGLSWVNFTEANSGLNSDFIWGLEPDAEGNMWIGTGGGLVVRYSNSTWEEWNYLNSTIPGTKIYDIAIDTEGNKWLASQVGLIKFDGTDFTVYDNTNSGMPYDIIFCIAIDANDKLWMGTKYGIVTYDGTDWEVIDNQNTGLSGSVISEITIDSHGNKWISAKYNSVAVYNENGINGLGTERINSQSQYLLTNFPNPATTHTTINYTLEETSDVKILLSDQNGKLIKAYNKGRQAKGNHQFIVDTKDFASGIYIYQLITTFSSQTGKLIINGEK